MLVSTRVEVTVEVDSYVLVLAHAMSEVARDAVWEQPGDGKFRSRRQPDMQPSRGLDWQSTK
jgi:hypothetical protein